MPDVSPQPESLQKISNETGLPLVVIAAWLLEMKSLDKLKLLIHIFKEVEHLLQEQGQQLINLIEMNPYVFINLIRGNQTFINALTQTLTESFELPVSELQRFGENLLRTFPDFQRNTTTVLTLTEDERNALIDEANDVFFNDIAVVEERITVDIHRQVWREALRDIDEARLQEIEEEAELGLDNDLEDVDEQYHEEIIQVAARQLQNRIRSEVIALDPESQERHETQIRARTNREVNIHLWERQIDANRDRHLVRAQIRSELLYDFEQSELYDELEKIRNEVASGIGRYWVDDRREEEAQRRFALDSRLRPVYQKVDTLLAGSDIEEEYLIRTAHWTTSERELTLDEVREEIRDLIPGITREDLETEAQKRLESFYTHLNEM